MACLDPLAPGAPHGDIDRSLHQRSDQSSLVVCGTSHIRLRLGNRPSGFDRRCHRLLRHLLPAQPALARPGLDARGQVPGAPSFSGSAGFGTNGYSAGGHAHDAALGERVVEERAAVEPAASVTDPSPATLDPEPEPVEDTAPSSGFDSEDRTDEEGEPVPAAAVPARHRADPGAAARMFDAATTRRRSVVFEEDDELDVPDFLK